MKTQNRNVAATKSGHMLSAEVLKKWAEIGKKLKAAEQLTKRGKKEE